MHLDMLTVHRAELRGLHRCSRSRSVGHSLGMYVGQYPIQESYCWNYTDVLR